MILMKLLLSQREDFKVIANFLLQRIEPLQPYIMPVNPFEEHKEAQSSMKGIKDAIIHLQEGKPLGIFPAGRFPLIEMKEGSLTGPGILRR